LIICLYQPHRKPKFAINDENSAMAGFSHAAREQPSAVAGFHYAVLKQTSAVAEVNDAAGK
jgi:hypothetical protein